jgi:hypothetical protein
VSIGTARADQLAGTPAYLQVNFADETAFALQEIDIALLLGNPCLLKIAEASINGRKRWCYLLEPSCAAGY